MAISFLFSLLGAPLHNLYWSWGAVRPVDSTVFLRVWRDETRDIEGSDFVQVLRGDRNITGPGNQGYLERLEHIELIQEGNPCYLIMCVAVDPKANPREIKDFNETHVFPGGRLIHLEGNLWMERLPAVPIGKVTIKTIERL